MDNQIPGRYSRSGIVLPSEFSTEAFDSAENDLPKLISADNNNTDMSVGVENDSSLLDGNLNMGDHFDFGVSLNSTNSRNSRTTQADDMLIDSSLSFMDDPQNNTELSNSLSQSFFQPQPNNQQSQLLKTSTQPRQNNRQQSLVRQQLHQNQLQNQRQPQQQRRQQSYLDSQSHDRNDVSMQDLNIWSLYNNDMPSSSNISNQDSNNTPNNGDFSLDSSMEEPTFPFFSFHGESSNRSNSLNSQQSQLNSQQNALIQKSGTNPSSSQNSQALQSYAQYARQQSVQHQQQLQDRQKQQQKQQHMRQPNQKPPIKQSGLKHTQQEQHQQFIQSHQNQTKPTEQYSELLRSRASSAHPPRISQSPAPPIMSTSQQQNSVSPGLFAVGSRPNLPSSLQNMYNGDYSPQHGPVNVPLQMIGSQPLLSPPITRLQADSPSENNFFSPIPPHEAELMLIRQKYKAKSSIPTDASSAHYGQQCISAAISSRLNPFSLHIGEHNLLRAYLTPLHVTTYLNIRNGILRLWLSNPKVNVTRSEAAGCAREERFFNLAEVAYDWLIRNGYINFGCFEYPSFDFYNAIPEEQRKPRKTVVIIGAGISGLSCARQLDNLFRRKARHFAEYQDTPRIFVLEGRRRIGGRIYSAHLKSDPTYAVDVGAHVVPGYGNGNPLAVLIRRQLGLPVEKINKDVEIHDSLSKDRVTPEEQERARKLFDHLLERVAQFRNTVLPPKTAKGDEVLIRVAKDPRDDYQEAVTIAKGEERGALNDNQIDESDYKSESEWCGENPGKIEVQFLKEIGIRLKPGVAEDAVIHLAPEPQFGMYPSLGMSMDALLRQLQEISEISPQELRLLNWYYANLEYQSATCLDNLSLGNWNQHAPKAFTGNLSIVKDGYMSLARGLYTYAEKLDVRFKSCASVVEYSNDHAEVFLENGEQIKADCVVVTAPLGVLKDRTIQFIPDLPKWKSDSIERLGFGVMNKICLIYEHAFWEEDRDLIAISQAHEGKNRYDQESYKNTRGMFYCFYNVTKAVGKPCLIGVLAGAAALQVANETDEFIVESAQRSLEVVYPEVRETTLVESIVTRWQVDRYSRGSYSYLGLEATGADYDLLARPIGETLFFAGEATSRSHPATVHGAYISGLRAANEVLTSLIGEINVPQPLCPSKDYVQQSNARLQQQQHSTSGLSSHVTPNSSLVGTPTQRAVVEPQQPLQISSVISTGPMESVIRYPAATQYNPPLPKSIDENSPEAQLKRLKEDRQSSDNERMRIDMIKELGERPMKPERSGANPFLIFQKDFWEKCRQECDAEKQKQTKDPYAKAARNDVRAALGKKWRELPEEEKEPYLKKTKNIKETNNKKSEQYREKMRRYDSEAEDFRRRWKEEHGSKPSEAENKLQRIIQEEKQLEKSQQQKHANSSIMKSPPGGSYKRQKFM